MSKRQIRLSIVVSEKEKEYLDNHPEINKSQLFRDAVKVTSHPLYQQLYNTIILNLITMLSIIAGFLLLFLIQYIAFLYILISWVIISSLILTLTIITIRDIRRRRNGKLTK